MLKPLLISRLFGPLIGLFCFIIASLYSVNVPQSSMIGLYNNISSLYCCYIIYIYIYLIYVSISISI